MEVFNVGVILFLISYFYIALKAAQQLAVVNFHMKYIIPTSMLLALCEVTTITILATHKEILYFPFIGLGAGLGAVTTMLLYKHRKLNGELK
jgi:hypothetical protein